MGKSRQQPSEPSETPASGTYRVEIKPAAQRDISRLPHQAQEAVVRRIAELRHQPRPPDVKHLEGPYWRVRVDVARVSYRVLYEITDGSVRLVVVFKVGTRGSVYDRCRRRI